jgi:VWFA-related protein
MYGTALAAMLFSASLATAQVRETVTVNLVEVPLTVVDNSGNPVRGLTAANFKLFEDGHERPIVAVDTVDLAAKVGASALATINPAARRNFLLLFDLSFTSPRSLANAQEASRTFVAKSVLPRDRVAVATLDLEHGFRLLTTFTSDRELLKLAINNPAGFQSGDPLQLSNESQVASRDLTSTQSADFLQQELDRKPLSGGPHPIVNEINSLREETDHSQMINRDISHSNDAYKRARVEKEVAFLAELAKTLRSVPGRKQIVFLSEGFDASVLIGRDATAGDAAKKESDLITSGSGLLFVDTDERYGSATSQRFLTDMVKYFRGSDVVLHAIDVRGVRVQNSIDGSGLSSNAGLSVLTGPTGGMLFQNANDLSGSFSRLLHAQEVVYILSFRGTLQKAGQFHDLKVKLAKVPGSPQLSYRSGYYEVGGESRDERTLTTAEIILNDIPQSGLRVDAFAMSFPTGTSLAQVPVLLEIPGGDLVGASRSEKPSLEVYIYAFDESGTVRDRLFQRVSLDLVKLRERLYDAGLKFVATLSLPPGKYAIRSLVRMPESERKGFVRSDVIVPEGGALTMLAPVFIDANASWVTIKGTSHAGLAPYPFHLGNTEFIPAATARIRSGETPQCAVFVQNALPDEVTVDSVPSAKLIGSAQGDGTSAFLLQFDDLAPSVATVAITLHKKGTEGVQTTSVRVEP